MKNPLPLSTPSDLAPSAKENLELVADFYEREESEVSVVRVAIERISQFFGSPAYFSCVIVFIVVWVLVNVWGVHAGWKPVDEPPFFLLQGIVSSNALLLTVAVLIRQNRMAQLAEHRAHLDLQINLLTEKKVTKLLTMFDELRRALPHGSTSNYDELRELAEPADPEAMLAAIKETDGKKA